MILYKVALAPNPTKVMLYIAEREALGVDFPIEQITVNTLKGEHKSPGHLARNPFGTLPVLELEDGSYLAESLAIIEYLEEKFPQHSLLGETAEERAKARDLERIIELRIANPLGVYVHAKKSPLGLPPDPEKAAALADQIQKPLDVIETLLSDGRPWLNGDAVSVADCTLQSAFQFVRFIEEDLCGERPKLREWDTRYRAHPPAQTVLKW